MTGCEWTLSSSQITFGLAHLCVYHKPICHPPQSQPSLLPEGDGSPEPGPTPPGDLSLDLGYPQQDLSHQRGWILPLGL